MAKVYPETAGSMHLVMLCKVCLAKEKHVPLSFIDQSYIHITLVKFFVDDTQFIKEPSFI